jgi:hypothetical protein
MQSVRLLGVVTLLLQIATTVGGEEPKLAEPTDKQLAAATRAYLKLGASYSAWKDPVSKETYYIFRIGPGVDLQTLPDLPFRFGLDLWPNGVTDDGLRELKGLKNLNYLDLCKTRVTDAGLKELKEFKNLRWLSLVTTRVTDDGIKELKNLESLAILGLGNTGITDAGLKELKNCKNLILLNLGNAKVSAAGIDDLKKDLPKCKIGYLVYGIPVSQ